MHFIRIHQFQLKNYFQASWRPVKKWWTGLSGRARLVNLLILCFLTPVVLMTAYFMGRGFAPFGTSSLLTVDLGQQYVDFFAWFRSALLHHPISFFYSFSKDLGGEMFGTSAYYLFSPLNLLFIFFKRGAITSGIMLILLLRYGLAGLSFAWVLHAQHLQAGFRLVGFATAYSLMGWMVANQLNMLWLDVIILLPLIIHGLIKLLNGGHPWTYVGWLAFQMIDNYYMAWMVCLFTILFTAWQLTKLPGWRIKLLRFGHYLLASLAAAGLAAVVLLPTIAALLQSKASYTSFSFSFKPEYSPWRILTKFVPGAFNFHQMPTGQPNVYVGMLATLLACYYLFDQRQQRSSRIVALLVTLFLLASCCLPVLDLLWHAGQYPVWYPSRFSFVISLWLLWLAATVLTPDFRISRHALAILIIFVLAVYAFLNRQQTHVTYLNQAVLIFGLLMAMTSLLAMRLSRSHAPYCYDFLVVLLMCTDVAVSAYSSLNNIAYVSQTEYSSYTRQLDNAVDPIKRTDHGFYRIGKDFMRTKDDPLEGDYAGGDHFSSNLEPTIPAFYGAIGQPDGDGFVSYNNGTELTDSLLGFKYYLQALNGGLSGNQQVIDITSMRPDLNQMTFLGQRGIIALRRNQYALPIAFGASSQVQQLHHDTLDPLIYQSEIYQTLAGQPTVPAIFNVQNFTHVRFTNVQKSRTITGTTFLKKRRYQPASVTMTFKVPTNDPYYLTLGSSVKSAATIMINNRPLNQYSTYRHTIVINLASHGQKGQVIHITLSLKHRSLWMQNVSVYQLNQRRFMANWRSLRRSPLHLQYHNDHIITGTINLKADQRLMMTTIPYANGWHVTVDGKTVSPVKVLGTFIAVPMSPGSHSVSLQYTPPLLKVGVAISLITLLTCIGLAVYQTNHAKH